MCLMYCYESKANYDALVQVRRINANFRSIHVEGANTKGYKLSEDDDVGVGTITDYEMSETPAQKQAREKRTGDEKKGTVEELMEKREQLTDRHVRNPTPSDPPIRAETTICR